MKWLTLIVLVLLATSAQCAPCPIGTSSTACPAFTACFSWGQPTTRADGSPFSAIETKGFEVKLDGNLVQSSMAYSYSYLVPPGQQLTTASVISIVTIDVDGNRSSPVSCSQPKLISHPKAPPGSVTSLISF